MGASKAPPYVRGFSFWTHEESNVDWIGVRASAVRGGGRGRRHGSRDALRTERDRQNTFESVDRSCRCEWCAATSLVCTATKNGSLCGRRNATGLVART